MNLNSEMGRDGALRRPRRRAQRQATERMWLRVKTWRHLFRPLSAVPCILSSVWILR